MKIIIVGAGVIGSNLAKSLSEEIHEVYLIESNEAIAQRLDEKIDAKVIVGNGSDPDALKRAQVQQADLVVAVTTSDETNLVVCSLAAAYGAKKRIARVRDHSLTKALEELGLNHFNIDETINPELIAANAIIKSIEAPGAREVADFAGEKILLRAFDVLGGSSLSNLRIEELRDEHFPWPFLIIAILREGAVIIPQGETTVRQNDRIYVLLPSASLGEFLSFLDPHIRPPEKIIIYGATETGERVAQVLSDHVRDVVLIEEDEEKAQQIAGRLKKAKVINGPGYEADILKECGIEAADAFVATSDGDHSNLISAVLAKKMGAKTTVITTHHPDYLTIVGTLDINTIINPRILAAYQILRLVRGRGISSVTKLVECNAEALELIPEEGALVTRGPIKDINFPKGSLVGAVSRDGEVHLANGDTRIQPGERVIVFCQEQAAQKLQKLFTRRKIL